MKSASLLLQHSLEPTKPQIQPSHQAILDPTSPTTKHLEVLTASIIDSFNAKDFSRPFDTFASPDYELRHRYCNGEVVHFDRNGAKGFVEDLVKSGHLHTDARILSLSTLLADDGIHATVWVTLSASDGGEGSLRERVSVHCWRKEGDRWVWWAHYCAGDVPTVPF